MFANEVKNDTLGSIHVAEACTLSQKEGIVSLEQTIQDGPL